MSPITIYAAKKIITMNPNQAVASHVAVKEGRILGVGSLEDLSGWGTYQLDQTFAEKYLLPGFVEGHAHTMEGTLWRYVYCGYFDRMDPNGTLWEGAKSIDAVLARLKAAEAKLGSFETPYQVGHSIRSIWIICALHGRTWTKFRQPALLGSYMRPDIFSM